MHSHESHIFTYCIAFWCVINVGETARSIVNPEILANFAKNVATVLSPVVLGEIQSRRNRSSLQSDLTESLRLDEDEDPDSSSSLDNIVDNTSNAGGYYQPDSYPYNGLYENSAERLGESEGNKQLKGSLREESYLQQKRPNFYNFPASNNNAEATQKSVDTAHIESSTGNIEQSSTNLFSSYHGGDFPKAGFPVAFLAKPNPGFYGFGPYGHGYHHHHHHHHPYGSDESTEETPTENARLENRTNHRGYGPSYGGHGYGHPYAPFPHYGGYGHYDSFYGSHRHNGNNSNGHHGHHGPYHGGPDFYGPPYGHHGHGYNGQSEESADGDQNNSTGNGYPHHHHPYGPPFIKPISGFPFPFSPYHHFHGGFKVGPVVGVGHIGYPLYADPYLVGFPFHPYGPFFHGKKYLPKDKPDSGESGETTTAGTPAGELSENENPERITALNNEEAAPASSSNRYKTSDPKALKVSLINFERMLV